PHALALPLPVFSTPPPPPQLYTLSLHDALPISHRRSDRGHAADAAGRDAHRRGGAALRTVSAARGRPGRRQAQKEKRPVPGEGGPAALSATDVLNRHDRHEPNSAAGDRESSDHSLSALMSGWREPSSASMRRTPEPSSPTRSRRPMISEMLDSSST